MLKSYLNKYIGKGLTDFKPVRDISLEIPMTQEVHDISRGQFTSNKLHINNNLIIELLSELENEGLIDSIFDSRLN